MRKWTAEEYCMGLTHMFIFFIFISFFYNFMDALFIFLFTFVFYLIIFFLIFISFFLFFFLMNIEYLQHNEEFSTF